MFFTNGTYYIFLIVIFFLYWLIAYRAQWRKAVLIFANLFFYATTGGRGLVLLLAISFLDFTCALKMSRTSAQRRRRIFLIISLIADLGALCLFKYINFFIDSTSSALSIFGCSIAPTHLQILAPIGISFFVFQSVAYVVDVYRKDTEPAQGYFEYLAFIAFFPIVVAGPILRAKQLLPQLRDHLTLDAAKGGQALFYISLGLIKKIAIADYLAANFIDRVFDFPERFSSLEILMAIYGYGLQIYADFSGYSDIAIGSALLLGFTLPANFNAPYTAKDLPEFWRRWHISLSTWLRDYLFFSFAGRRARNTQLLYCGLVLTMLIGGLWHGASVNFVIWGALHGVGLVVVRVTASLRKRFKFAASNSFTGRAFSVFVTFHFVCMAWVFFRAENLALAITTFRQLSTLTIDTTNLALPVALLIAIGLFAHWIPERIFNLARDGFVRLPSVAQASALLALAFGLYLIASADFVPFVYSRF